MLLSSDGLTEAHSPEREMLGVSRVIDTIGSRPEGESLIGVVLSELDTWTGPDWEQEDDVTLVLVQPLLVGRAERPRLHRRRRLAVTRRVHAPQHRRE